MNASTVAGAPARPHTCTAGRAASVMLNSNRSRLTSLTAAGSASISSVLPLEVCQHRGLRRARDREELARIGIPRARLRGIEFDQKHSSLCVDFSRRRSCCAWRHPVVSTAADRGLRERTGVVYTKTRPEMYTAFWCTPLKWCTPKRVNGDEWWTCVHQFTGVWGGQLREPAHRGVQPIDL